MAKIDVYIIATASKCIGTVEAATKKEFIQKANELWKSIDFDYPTTNISNNFDIGDWEIDETDWDINQFLTKED